MYVTSNNQLHLVAIEPYKIIAWPTPTSDILYVEIDTDTDARAQSITAFDIRLYNEQGNLLRQTTTARDSKAEFNLSNLPNGTYYLHVYDGISKTPEKRQIIVEH